MAASQAPYDIGDRTSEAPSEGAQDLGRYFEYDQTLRESLLRAQVNTEADKNALEHIFASKPWQEQQGELDRFQLQALYETRLQGTAETFYCRFSSCGYSNKESTNAVEHIRGTHFGNRPFLCRYQNCDKAFTRRYDLQTHQQTHIRSALFKCRYCGTDFTRKANRTRHEQHSHPDLYKKEDPDNEDLVASLE